MTGIKTVTVHRGGRDGYQVARSLQEAGLLQTLVTDLYWPADRKWAHQIASAAPSKVFGLLECRHADGLPSSSVASRWVSGLASLGAHKSNWLPFKWQSGAIRWCDADLGKEAGRLATEKQAALLSYSYYAHSAFSNYQGRHPKTLFQLHPHPTSVRSILQRERDLHPDCASSLDKEWELVLPELDFKHLVEEVSMADRWIVASQFTKQTLVAANVPAERVGVIPYGIDLTAYSGKKYNTSFRRPLKLLFVGTLGQRKGIKYLLEAAALLPPGSVELTVCGRPVDDLSMFRRSKAPVKVFPSISAQGLREAYKSADVFVFPSLAEGFGHVLLEAMASGLPVIATTRTAAPDLFTDGEAGFIINPGSARELAEAIERFLQMPEKVQAMGQAARKRAGHFSWELFRRRIVDFVREGAVADPGSCETQCSLH